MANRNDKYSRAIQNANNAAINAAYGVAGIQQQPQQRQQPLLPRPQPLLPRPQQFLRNGADIRREQLENARLEEQRRLNEILREQERIRARQMIDEYQRLEAKANEEKSIIGKDLFYKINE
jgi:hypothetical protein